MLYLRYFIKCACTFHTEPNKEKEAGTAPVKGELKRGRVRMNSTKLEAERVWS